MNQNSDCQHFQVYYIDYQIEIRRKHIYSFLLTNPLDHVHPSTKICLSLLFLRLRLDSIAASLFVLNWLSWQIVSDDKIQITILILRRGALSRHGRVMIKLFHFFGWTASFSSLHPMVHCNNTSEDDDNGNNGNKKDTRPSRNFCHPARLILYWFAF